MDVHKSHHILAGVRLRNMSQAEHEVIELEKQFWSESNNRSFFERVFADDGLTAIEPMGFVDKSTAVEMSEQSPGWDDLQISDLHTVQITPDCIGVLYHGMAKRRNSGESYKASLVSVYARRNGEWQLVITAHQPWRPPEDRENRAP